MSEDKSSAGEWLAGIIPVQVARVLRDDVRAPMVARVDTCAEEPAEMLLMFLAERDQMLAELRAKLAERDKRILGLEHECSELSRQLELDWSILRDLLVERDQQLAELRANLAALELGIDRHRLADL